MLIKGGNNALSNIFYSRRFYGRYADVPNRQRKGQVMNRGTKIRVIAFAVACVNQSIASVGAVDLGNETANLIYNIISLAFTIAAGSFALYYNNDFTVEGETGTKLTREMKAFRNETVTEQIEPDDSEVVEDGEE